MRWTINEEQIIFVYEETVYRSFPSQLLVDTIWTLTESGCEFVARIFLDRSGDEIVAYILFNSRK